MTDKPPPLRPEKGWRGIFTRDQAPGARYPNSSRIRKTVSEVGDATPTGTTGTVLGSILAPEDERRSFGYFVEWDNRKRHAVFVIERKIGPAEESP
jgi:hypothetical protein